MEVFIGKKKIQKYKNNLEKIYKIIDRLKYFKEIVY
jgi:hypothetical protein